MAFCSKCGTEISEGSQFCPNCGASESISQNSVQANSPVTIKKQKIDIVSIICFAVAGLVLLLSLIACFKMMGGAGELADLRSQAGNTVAEFYYNECGTIYSGFALFIMAFGLFASGLLSYLGFKNMKNQ